MAPWMHFRKLPVTCLKNLGTFSMSGFVATLPGVPGEPDFGLLGRRLAGPLPARSCALKIPLQPIFGRPALVNRQGATLNLVLSLLRLWAQQK